MPQYYNDNRPLTKEEMHVNAQYFYQLLRDDGWTLNAIAGLFGNAQSESRLNPGAWQNYTDTDADADDKGYGFVQWTPARDYIAWCTSNHIYKDRPSTVLRRFNYEAANNLQYYKTSAYPTPATFWDFMRSNDTPRHLAEAFLFNYERPQTPDPKTRGDQAEYWYAYLGGQPLPHKKLKWIYYLKRR